MLEGGVDDDVDGDNSVDQSHCDSSNIKRLSVTLSMKTMNVLSAPPAELVV